MEDVHIVKNDLFDLPPLFRIIQEESQTDWKEMYKVFNMGHRMEIYCDEEIVDDLIEISESQNVRAKVIGHVEPSPSGKKLTIHSQYGHFEFS